MDGTPFVDAGDRTPSIGRDGVMCLNISPERKSEEIPSHMQNTSNRRPDGNYHSVERDTLREANVTWLDRGRMKSTSNPRRFVAAVLRCWLRAAALVPPSGMRTPTPHTTTFVPEDYTCNFGPDALSAILEDLWAAERCLQPYFDVALLCTPPLGDISPSRVIGVMTGSARPHSKSFYIQGLSLHPRLFMNTDELLLAGGLMVESAIDASLEAGLQGWVISSSTEQEAAFWRTLGFAGPVGPFVKRMGYFDHPPLRRPG